MKNVEEGAVVSYYYYYGTEITFNYWMVVAPVGLALVILLGLKQYDWWQGNIVRVFENIWYERFAVVVSIVILIMLMVESGDGIIQYLDNRMAASGYSAAYAWQSVLAMPFVAMIPASIYGAMLYFVGRLAGLAKAGWLYEEKRKWRCKRWEQRKQARDEACFR